MAFQYGSGWAGEGWQEDCGISLFTLDRLDCSDPPDCLPWIGSGWVVNCDEQLFTLAWVCCDGTVIELPVGPDVGGGSSKAGRRYAPGVSGNRKIAMTEDEEVIAVLQALLFSRTKN